VKAPSFCATRAAGALVARSGPADTKFLQDDLKRAKVRERRLQQVETDERGEPEPIGAVIVREHEAHEDKRAGEAPDDHVHFHILVADDSFQRFRYACSIRAANLKKVTTRAIHV
jgi:hypothetical protein